MHLSDGQIQRLIHGEIDDDARAAAERHIAGCTPCARAHAAATRDEAEIFDLLGEIDHAPPVVDAARFTVPARGAAWGRRAAGIVVAAALAGAAYAIPGSPLPALVDKLAAWVTGEAETPPAAVDESTTGAPVTSGIAVSAGGDFLIQFASAQTAGSVTVSLTDDPMIRVRVVGGAAAFTTDAGRLDIANPHSFADYEIELPRHAPSVEIRVGNASVLRKDGDRVTTDAPADADGRYRVPLSERP